MLIIRSVFSIKQYLRFFHSFISNKSVTCNDEDPPWFNEEIR